MQPCVRGCQPEWLTLGSLKHPPGGEREGSSSETPLLNTWGRKSKEEEGREAPFHYCPAMTRLCPMRPWWDGTDIFAIHFDDCVSPRAPNSPPQAYLPPKHLQQSHCLEVSDLSHILLVSFSFIFYYENSEHMKDPKKKYLM